MKNTMFSKNKSNYVEHNLKQIQKITLKTNSKFKQLCNYGRAPPRPGQHQCSSATLNPCVSAHMFLMRGFL